MGNVEGIDAVGGSSGNSTMLEDIMEADIKAEVIQARQVQKPLNVNHRSLNHI